MQQSNRGSHLLTHCIIMGGSVAIFFWSVEMAHSRVGRQIYCSARGGHADEQVEARRRSLISEVQSICICGYNPRQECDAGGELHCISDCYDAETGDNCGYDDQSCGSCEVER